MDRSEIMRRVRQSDTQPEMHVRRTLHSLGYRYRLHDKHLPGRPDIVFPSRRLVVFVHGCFWHRHPGCAKGGALPQNRREYWAEKFKRNEVRDIDVANRLRQLGWTVHVIWECQLRDEKCWVSAFQKIAGQPRAKLALIRRKTIANRETQNGV